MGFLDISAKTNDYRSVCCAMLYVTSPVPSPFVRIFEGFSVIRLDEILWD